uniref:Uncharacterized protein n=1 Tax=Rhizophora mucronata TaxID=61149 RepID=A0A2P2IUG2_RHIMU
MNRKRSILDCHVFPSLHTFYKFIVVISLHIFIIPRMCDSNHYVIGHMP